MSTMLERIRKVASGELPAPPIATLIGFTLRDVEVGHAVVDFEADARHANPMGSLKEDNRSASRPQRLNPSLSIV